MRFNCRGKLLLVLAVCLSVTTSCTAAQTEVDSNYQAKRQKAEELFQQGRRLEALPFLEELAQANPKDDLVLVALAASLVDHAATLPDEEAAGKERLRARALLDKASALGNTSALAENLSQLLGQLPANGSIKFSDNPAVEQAMRLGEAAFSRRDFEPALKNYSRALELEPGNYSAALFTGNTFDKMDQFAKAGEWYEKAIQTDPNIETAYRYYADMLAKQGDMSKARAMLIHAAVAEPYNRIVWREINAWATINNTKINLLYVGVPAEPAQEKNATAKPDADQVRGMNAAWQAYRSAKAKWQQNGEFQKHFPQEKEYRHSLPEESSALTAAAGVLERLKREKNTADLVAKDQNASLLLRLDEAGFIEPYVLFSLGDSGIARDYAAYRAKHRNSLEEYMDKFVVPPAPAANLTTGAAQK
jgi:tetratricopeptide (TPR) repeat protein